MAARLAPPGPPDYRRLQAAYQKSLRAAEDVRRRYQQLERAAHQSLLGLTHALEARDPETRGHSDRVAELSRRIAVVVGLGHEEVAAVGEAGRLHDIGKIGVPEPALRKAGPLTGEEWKAIRRHSLVGAQIVAPFEAFADAAPLIRHHHERWDGSGYPDGLAGSAIPLGARIVAVADVFDALTSSRHYRAARGREAALAQLAGEAGRTLDPHLVSACIGLLRAGPA